MGNQAAIDVRYAAAAAQFRGIRGRLVLGTAESQLECHPHILPGAWAQPSTHALILVRAIQEWVKGAESDIGAWQAGKLYREVDQFGTPGLLGLEQL